MGEFSSPVQWSSTAVQSSDCILPGEAAEACSHNWGVTAEVNEIVEQQLKWTQLGSSSCGQGGETSQAYLAMSACRENCCVPHCANVNRGESSMVLMDAYRHVDKHGDLLSLLSLSEV